MEIATKSDERPNLAGSIVPGAGVDVLVGAIVGIAVASAVGGDVGMDGCVGERAAVVGFPEEVLQPVSKMEMIRIPAI